MENKEPERKLAIELLFRLDDLVYCWTEYFNQKNQTSLYSYDGGLDVTYIETSIIRDALEVIQLFFENPNNPKLPPKIIIVDKAFKLLFEDFWGEFFDVIPDEIDKMAYSIYACYKHREIVFRKLNKDRLNHYLKTVEKDKKNYLLWKKNTPKES